jgi:hypothetical protein
LLHGIQMARRPIFDFNVSAGYTLFFPPGMIHSTRVVSEQCSLSLSLPLFEPSPVEYLAAFSEHLAGDAPMAGRCFVDSWNKWFFGESIPGWSASVVAMEDFANRLFPLIDGDNSTLLSSAEIQLYFAHRAPLMSTEDANVVPVDRTLLQQLAAVNFLETHDWNRDGLVSRGEFNAPLFAVWRQPFAQLVVRTIYMVPIDTDMDNQITRSELQAAFPDKSFESSGLPEVIDGAYYDARIEDLHALFVAASSEPSVQEEAFDFALRPKQSEPMTAPAEFGIHFDHYGEGSHLFRLDNVGLAFRDGDKWIGHIGADGKQEGCGVRLRGVEVADVDPQSLPCQQDVFDIASAGELLVFTARKGRVLFVHAPGEVLWMGRVDANWKREGIAALVDLGKKSAERQQWAAGEDATNYSRLFRPERSAEAAE